MDTALTFATQAKPMYYFISYTLFYVMNTQIR